MDEAALDRYAEAAWVLRCERSAEAKERPPVTVPWKDRAPFLREIDKAVIALVADLVLKDLAGPGSYGRLVRETWVAWAKEQDDPKPSWLLEWEELDGGQQEVDERIGSAVAARAVADAGLVNERRDAQLFALRCHLAAVLDALRIAAADTGYGSRAKRYSAALEALGGGQGQERDDEKEPA